MMSTKFTYRKIVVVFMPSQTKFTIFTVIGKGNLDFQTKQVQRALQTGQK